jgi:hypothetical protein
MLSIPHLSTSARARRRAADANNDEVVNTSRPVSRDLALVSRSPAACRPELPAIQCAAPRATRRVRRVLSRNCRNLQRFGYDHPGFRSSSANGTANEQRMTDALQVVQRQVAELERRRALLESVHFARYANARQLAAHKTREYYDHFCSGFDPRIEDRSRVLEAVVRSVLLDTVQSPAFATIDQFLTQWANYSKYHARVSVEIESIEPMDDHCDRSSGDDIYGDALIIKCAGRTTFRISRDTIQHFFQPIMQDESLVQQLLGKEYCFPFVTLFHFSTDSGRVFRMEPRADLAAGLFNLVTDPFATVKLLRASQLTTDGLLNAYPETESAEPSRCEIVEVVGDAA